MTTHKRLINNPRIFLDPGSEYAITTTLSSAYASSSSANIGVVSAADFKASGFITINDEIIYYTGHNSNTFTGITRGGKGTTAASHLNGATVSQARTSLNPRITTNDNLAGWYIDGTTNQASLRVYDAPVIQPGVVRFKENDNGVGGVFQGCTIYGSSGPTWVEFNAEKGDTGEAGDINTSLQFVHVTSIDGASTSNSGEIVKSSNTEVVDSESSNIEIRRIVPGSRTINQVATDTIAISTTTNDVVLNPISHPYIWNLAQPLSTIKGTPASDTVLNAYGQSIIAYVVPSTQIYKGQVVYLNQFVSNSITYIGVQPLEYTSLAQLNNYKASSTSVGLGMVGIARDTIDATGVTSIDADGVSANIAIDGLAIIKISSNITLSRDGNPFRLEAAVNYTGRPCLLSKDGFGFNNDQEPSVGSSTYFQIGLFMETGANISSDGNYAVIKLSPQFVSA